MYVYASVRGFSGAFFRACARELARKAAPFVVPPVRCPRHRTDSPGDVVIHDGRRYKGARAVCVLVQLE